MTILNQAINEKITQISSQYCPGTGKVGHLIVAASTNRDETFTYYNKGLFHARQKEKTF